ncbi:MAG TPA: hypothetical protein VNU97_11480 [Rhizomicrobium sp.]|jgi:hypothetical protein|nr:hypothetical protein [Rhizomicrobium sp.]
MSAIGLRASGRAISKYSVIGATADFRHHDFFFSRTQSLAMRDLPWESRLKPIRPWHHIATLAGVVAMLSAMAANVL